MLQHLSIKTKTQRQADTFYPYENHFHLLKTDHDRVFGEAGR